MNREEFKKQQFENAMEFYGLKDMEEFIIHDHGCKYRTNHHKLEYYNGDDWQKSICYANLFIEGGFEIEKLTKIPQERFVPKLDEEFWLVDYNGEVNWEAFMIECPRFNFVKSHNLIFETKDQAEDYKWFLDKVDEYKRDFELGCSNHYLGFDCTNREIKIAIGYHYLSVNIYFGNKMNNIEKFIKEVGEERIKKYMFNIWE